MPNQTLAPQGTDDTALPPIIDTLPDVEGDDQQNVIRLEHSFNGLPVTLLRWKDAATAPGQFDEISVSINDRPVHIKQIEGPINASITILVRTPDLAIHGYINLVYAVTPSATSITSTCLPVRLFSDQFDPELRGQPKAIILPDDLPNGEVTRAYLAQHGGLTLELPRSRDSRGGDTFDVRYDSNDPTGTVGSVPTTGPITVHYTEDQILAAGPGMKWLSYIMCDRAGNTTIASRIQLLNVTLS